MGSPWHDRENLERLYHGEGLSQKEVAERLGCSRETVVAWMKKLDVDTRSSGETRYLDTRERLRENKEDIVERYQSGEPLYVLGEGYDVQDHTIKKFLEDQGIETRDISEQLEKSFSTERADSLDVNTIRELRDPGRLWEMHFEEKMSAREIGRELGCSSGTVIRWFQKHGIEARPRSEAVELAHRTTPGIHTGEDGYEYINHSGYVVRHHRLLATLLVDEITDLRGMHVHHETGVEWDNRLSKLEVLDFQSHMAEHREAAYE